MKTDKIPCSSIVFDCDGVIFDSNELKVEAFRNALAAYPPNIVDEFILYHKKNAGVSRYVKFRIFFNKFLDVDFDKCEFEKLLENYGKECRYLYQHASLTTGCLQALKDLSSIVPLYVASGSDELELREAVKERQLHDYFIKIFGSPKTKLQCVQEALNDIGFSTNVVMIGDAESDWNAAQKVGISFIFVARYSENCDTMTKLAEKHRFGIIESLEYLKEMLILKA